MVKNTALKTDLSLLLEPINAKDPCGETLRYTDVYDQIREARREDDEHLPQGVWKTEIKKADWEQVSRLCQEAIKFRSKDLQIAAWLTEAWLHLEGVGGIARGLELILGLTQKFWPEIYPQLNDKGYELRVIPYEWINTRLSEEVSSVLISMPSDHTALPYHFLDFTEANLREFSGKLGTSQSTSHQIGDKPVSSTKISLSIDQTPTAFYRHINECCDLALKVSSELEEQLRVHLEGAAPGFYRLREKIEGIQRFSCHILDERGEKSLTKKPTTAEIPEAPPQKKSFKGSIENREQAYAILSEVASFLERVEPHSPTPYLVRRAITWGGMTLSQVISDTLHNGQDMSLLLDLLNVKKE